LPAASDPHFLDLLRDPLTHHALETRGRALLDPLTGRRYPIIDGIPSFIASQPLPLRHRFWRRFYDRAAFAYDAVLALGQRLGLGAEPAIRRRYLAAQPLPPRARILEIGAGTAANRPHLPADSFYLGLDISLGMLRRAQRRLRGEGLPGFLLHADAQSLPLKDSRFHLVLCMGVLQHLSEPPRALAEMARAARPGGVLLILDERARLRRLLNAFGQKTPRQADALATLAQSMLPSACRLEEPPRFVGDYFAIHLQKMQ
jgi:ubiquinone/menaquinone biosynthesis C-methylase UbiE/uncharacterized protein YbaR (Trm112 family)